jgi:hypothetical protein
MTQPTYREHLENRFAELQFDLLLLVGVQSARVQRPAAPEELFESRP